MLDSTINQNNNLYSKFSGNNLVSNKNYLSEVYGKRAFYTSNNDVMYYNDENAQQNKKKSHKKAILISVASGLSILSALGFAIFRNKNLGGKFKNTTSRFLNKATENPITNKSVNFMVNQQIKDDIWDRIATKLYNDTPFKFVKNWGDKLSELYKKVVKNSSAKQYNDALESVKKYAMKEGIDIANLGGSFDEIFKTVDTSVNKLLKENRISSGLTKGKNKNKIVNVLNNMTSGILSDEKIAKVYDDILIKIPQNASDDLKHAIEKYNNLFAGTIIPKLRDINCGAAPMDVVSVLVPVGALGLGMANAKDKEERKSILIDIGIPLISTASMPIVGNFIPVLNGIKAMVAGFAVGNVFSGAAKIIDKAISGNKDKNSEQKTISA